MGIRTGTAVCGEVELFYEDLGDPAGAPVLLIMGVGAQLPMWPDGFCELLIERGYRVIRYDHRDTGQSTTGTPGAPSYGGWQLGRDCVGLIEALGVAGVTFGEPGCPCSARMVPAARQPTDRVPSGHCSLERLDGSGSPPSLAAPRTA